MSRSAGAGRTIDWLAATCAFAVIGCTWALAVARYGGPDEPSHIIRAAAVAHGDLLGDAVARLEPGYRQVEVPGALASGDPKCYRHDENATAECAVVEVGSPTRVVATSAGTAPPWYYLAVGWMVRAVSSGGAAMSYRIANVILCAAIFGYAMSRCVSFGRGSWLLLALTPAAWFLLAVTGTSAIEIALISVALVEAVARFHTDGSASLLRVVAPLAVCLLLRPAGLIDVIVVALVVWPTIRPLTRRAFVPLSVPLAVMVVGNVVWNRWTGLVFRDERTADSNSFAAAVRHSLRGIPTTAHQAVGALGWNEFFAPALAQLMWVASLGFAVWWVGRHTSAGWWYARWAALGLLLPTVLEVVVHRRIGGVWQGRYSIPFAMAGVLYAARAALPPRRVMTIMLTGAAAAEVLTLWHTLRRYMVGLDGSLTLRDAAWHPSLNPWLLLAINACAITWLAAISLGTFTLRSHSSDSQSPTPTDLITVSASAP